MESGFFWYLNDDECARAFLNVYDLNEWDTEYSDLVEDDGEKMIWPSQPKSGWAG